MVIERIARVGGIFGKRMEDGTKWNRSNIEHFLKVILKKQSRDDVFGNCEMRIYLPDRVC